MSHTPDISPRIVSKKALGPYLGKSESWLHKNIGDLQAKGFPVQLPYVNGWDLREVDAWLDKIRVPANSNEENATWEGSYGRFK